MSRARADRVLRNSTNNLPSASKGKLPGVHHGRERPAPGMTASPHRFHVSARGHHAAAMPLSETHLLGMSQYRRRGFSQSRCPATVVTSCEDGNLTAWSKLLLWNTKEHLPY